MAFIKPMLAINANANLSFPMLLSPKLDGVRCMIVDGVAMSRSLKPIPNKRVQELFGREELNGLDGELIVGLPNVPSVFQTTTSGVMTIEGNPFVSFNVFDDYSAQGPFVKRLAVAKRRITPVKYGLLVPHRLVTNEQDLTECEQFYLDQGYEGVMLRDPQGPYKSGRCTQKEGWLLKVKRFEDSEAEVIGLKEAQHNANEAKRNKLGNLERASCKVGKVGKSMLGALCVRDLKTGVEFDIGTGFTEAQRRQLWIRGEKITGSIVKYKSQPTGVKDKPRFPVFIGFRSKLDM